MIHSSNPVAVKTPQNTRGLHKVLQFFSIAALTQLTLALSQIVLLPIQIRMWGHAGTATWYSAVAIASFTSAADCGLRTAGHPEILRFTRDPDGSSSAREHFRQVWAWLRIFVVGGTLLLIGGDLITSLVQGKGSYATWRAILIVAYSLETMLIVRTVYLDTLDLYRRSEASYFIFSALRLALAVPALLIFHLQATGLAWLFLGTSTAGLAVQGMLVRRHISAVTFFEPIPRKLSFRIVALTRHTFAEPCANWIRLSLPVLVISAIASAAAVTMYVALRATFGAVRASIAQLARVASVEFLQLASANREAAAESVLAVFILFAVFCGTAIAGVVVVDNLRILGLWLSHFDRETFHLVELSFASSAFFSYQVILLLMFRQGKLASIAHRHWAYVAYSAVFAGLAFTVKLLPLYLVMLLAAEVFLSLSFILPVWSSSACVASKPVRSRVSQAALAGSLIVLMLLAAAEWNIGGIFLAFEPGPVIWSAVVLVSALVLFAGFAYINNADIFRMASAQLGISRSADAIPESSLMNSNVQV